MDTEIVSKIDNSEWKWMKKHLQSQKIALKKHFFKSILVIHGFIVFCRILKIVDKTKFGCETAILFTPKTFAKTEKLCWCRFIWRDCYDFGSEMDEVDGKRRRIRRCGIGRSWKMSYWRYSESFSAVFLVFCGAQSV